MNSDKKKIYIFFIINFIIHIIFINNYPINFEFTFSNFSKFFENYDKSIIDQYFLSQANTIAFPFVAGLISKSLNIENGLITTRIISLLSYIFLLLGLINFSKYYKFKINFLIVTLFFLNPLIWVYGYRGTPDLISASLGFYGLSGLWNLKFDIKKICYSFLIAFSIVLKPHCFIFGLILCLHYLIQKRNNLFDNYLYLIITIPILIILFFSVNYKLFGFFLYSNNYQEALSLNLPNFINNFLSYFGLLFLSVFPISIIYFFDKKILMKIIFYLFIFILGYLFLELYGEMDLGSLTSILGKKNLAGIVLCFVVIGFINIRNLIIIEKKKNNKNFVNPLIISIVIYILILSFFRPVQRYLMVILPFLYLLFFMNFKIIFDKKFIIYFMILITVNFVLSLNSILNSKISSKVADYLLLKNINNQTDLGPINANANFIITEKNRSKIFYLTNNLEGINKYEKKFNVGLFNIINKNLYLVKY